MTVKLSISVPDDVAAYLQGHGNASAAVTDAVRRILPEQRRARQRSSAEALADHVRQQTPDEAERDRMLIETSNDIALRDAEW
jgi:hypothetical protein